MHITRRTLLGGLLGLLPLRPAVALPQTEAGPSLITLGAFLDTLLPGDDLSPAASALGIPRALLGDARTGSYARLLGIGCAWLDAQGRKRYGAPFAALTEAQRVTVVVAAEAAPAGRPEQVFLTAVLADCHRRYYSDPRSWPALGYAGPPQPMGFPDHDQPPGASG